MTRRGALGSMAAITAASVAAAGTPGAALASDLLKASADVKVISGKYAIPGGSIIDGVIAVPRRKSRLDVALLLHAEGASSDSVRQAAVRYASAGYLVVAPDLRASFGRSLVGASHDALTAAAARSVPNLAKMSRGNGKVRVVQMEATGSAFAI